jgi:hypothetical protein
MNISNWIFKHRKAILIAWIILVLLMIYPTMLYSQFISYSQQNYALKDRESYIVSQVLSSKSNDTLILVVNSNPFNVSADKVLNFEKNVNSLPYVFKVSSPFSSYIAFLSQLYSNKTLAQDYVEKYGLKNIPDFLIKQYISKDNSTFLIFITLNVTSDYYLSNGQTPSQELTPKIKEIASKYFSSYYLTGQGAIQYETQQISSSSGFLFGVLFIVLAIAVGITLRSYKASILALAFASIATVIGYVGIYISGLIIGKIDFVVNYTLTAVLLGITTDYLVFMLGRLREERENLKDEKYAISITINKAGKVVLISGLTVGLSLLTFSFIPSFVSWGVVLFVSILITIVLMTTLLSAIISIFDYKLLGKSRTRSNGSFKRSFFYKTAYFSEKRKILVIALILIFAIPSLYLFFNLPTTYDISTGLPSNLNSIQGIKVLQDKFGSTYLFPVYVVVNTTDISVLMNVTKYLLSVKGITGGIGPYLLGNNVVQNNASQFFIGGHYYYYILYLNYTPYSNDAIKVVETLRNNSSLLVGGLTSDIIDQKVFASTYYPLLEILITLAVALVIGISFRSLKYPLISISGVFISISWATAILYIISNYFLSQELIYLIPVIIFVIMMSLGNDYSVFIISKAEEEIKNNVKDGLLIAFSKTGKIVTSLGIILALSLGVLALFPVGFLEQLGIGFIITLLIDTFIIRNFYFPAMISLMRKIK